MSDPVISCAAPADEPDLRRLMREIDMPGAIGMAFEREPDFFQAVEIEGDERHVIVARLDDKIVGLACLTRRPLFVNGVQRTVSYFSTARVERNWRGRRVTPRALAAVRDILARNNDAFCICTLVKDNAQAHSFLLGRHRLIPEFKVREQVCTIIVPTWRKHGSSTTVAVRPAERRDLNQIVDCLRRNGQRRQFAVAWTCEDLISDVRTRGLDISDFYVAEDTGNLVGCIALWDQSSFKQSVITGYGGLLKKVFGRSSILRRRSSIRPVCRSPAARWITFICRTWQSMKTTVQRRLRLLDAAYREARRRGVGKTFTFGLSERDPRLSTLKPTTFGGIRYWTELCTVVFPGGEALVGGLDDRPGASGDCCSMKGCRQKRRNGRTRADRSS